MKKSISIAGRTITVSAVATVMLAAMVITVQAIAPVIFAGVAVGSFLLGYSLTDDPVNSTAQDELGIYQEGLTVGDRADSYLTVRENYNQDTKQVAYGKVQASICQDIKAGETEAVAASNAKSEVDEYYSVQQSNNINEWNAEWESLNATAHNELVVTANSRTNIVKVENSDGTNDAYWTTDKSLVYATETLLNGTSIQVVDQVEVVYDSGSNGIRDLRSPLTGSEWVNAEVVDPQDSSDTIVIDSGRWNAVFPQSETKATEVKSGVDTYATDVYAAYSAGDLEGVPCQDPTVAAGSMPDDGSSALTFIVYSAAVSGYETSAQMNVNITDETTGETYDAVYFTSAQPTTTYDFGNGSEPAWLVGNTYNASDYAEPVYIAFVDSSGESTTTAELDGEYTINSATEFDTGASVDAIQASNEYAQKTYDSTTFIEQLNDIQDQIDDLEDSESSGGSGGAFDGLFEGLEPIVKWAVIGILGLLGIKAFGFFD